MTYYRHNLDPIAFTIDGFAVSWYWLNYLFSFFLISFFLIYLQKKGETKLSRNHLIDHLLVSWFGVLIGGRFGYVFIYNFEPFAQNPELLLHIWLGGMSFHGALLGMIIANYALAYWQKRSLFEFTDLATLGAPIALFTGRVFNFVNGELWGRPSNLPWAVIFPEGGGEIPRHPSQLYQAMGEGVLLFAFLWLARKRATRPGQLSSLFLMGYGTIRFFLEFFREPDSQLGYYLNFLSMGQILCLFMVISGGILLYCTRHNTPST